MAAKIRCLSEQTINEIAAGEVIENPASVVKELVENAIDAQSTEINIEIKGGGRQLIRISDNGCGMAADDAILALERHATSKIAVAADIFAIGSLGFRGEAIPSIASISKFTMLTAPRTSEGVGQGTLVIVEGGRLFSSGPAVRDPGTTIEVKQLFFNVPVRRKFQGSPTYDAQAIEKVCIALALSHPRCSFSLTHNGETVLRAKAPDPSVTDSEALGQRIHALFGADFYDALCPMHVEADDITISGFVAAPHHHRANRSGQYLLINGRNVQAPFLSNCVREGYGTLLPTQRHPLFVLTVALPADTIDVNVHPQKREVRFLREPLLKQLMRRGIEAALHHIPQEPLAQNTLHPLASLTAATQQQPIANSWIDDSPTIWMPPLERIDTGDRVVPVKMPHPNAVAAQNSTADLKPLPWENSSIVATPYAAPLPPPVSTQLKLAMDTSQLPIPTLIATLPGYLLLNSNDACKSRLLTTQLSSAPALFLVDHRRAHQRILYEKLISARTTAIEVQSLLIPYALDFVPADHLIIQEQQVELGALGLALQQIGPHSWSVESIPICLGNVDLAILFEQLINAWRQTAHLAAPIDHLLAKQLCAAASKAAVQGESQLSMAEGQALLEQLWHCRQPALCPSGMPTAAYFTTAELQRRFQNSA